MGHVAKKLLALAAVYRTPTRADGMAARVVLAREEHSRRVAILRPARDPPSALIADQERVGELGAGKCLYVRVVHHTLSFVSRTWASRSAHIPTRASN